MTGRANTGSLAVGAPGTVEISGWGNSHKSTCAVTRPESREQLTEIFQTDRQGGIIARGCGRSYGDQATNANGEVIETCSLQQIESFDPESGVAVCESGVTLNALIDQFLPKGFVPAVCPGTGFVSVGGAIANDVHGKNNFSNGSFGSHVEWLELLARDGSLQKVSQQSNPALYSATVGGIGLSGMIVRAAIRLSAVSSRCLSVTDYRIRNLPHFMERLAETRRAVPHTVGWIDATARGKDMGRGILSCAQAADDDTVARSRRNLSVPFNLPQFVLNRHSVRLFNFAYRNRIRSERTKVQAFTRFVFPLDALLRWNRLYGRKGVYQFQCVVPFEAANSAIPELMRNATTSAYSSPLAVLKTLSHDGHGMLSFPKPGFTLALDFPRTRETSQLISRMYDIAIDNGGRAYLAKDACLSAAQFRRMYPDTDDFLQVLASRNAGAAVVSDMARRLHLQI